MASIWMLSKNAMRGMNIVSAISDYLYEIKTNEFPSDETTNRMIAVLESISQGARAYIGVDKKSDSFSMLLAEAVSSESAKTPTELVSTLEECSAKLKTKANANAECLNLFRIISQNAIQIASKRVDKKLLLLH